MGDAPRASEPIHTHTASQPHHTDLLQHCVVAAPVIVLSAAPLASVFLCLPRLLLHLLFAVGPDRGGDGVCGASGGWVDLAIHCFAHPCALWQESTELLHRLAQQQPIGYDWQHGRQRVLIPTGSGSMSGSSTLPMMDLLTHEFGIGGNSATAIAATTTAGVTAAHYAAALDPDVFDERPI